MGAYDNPKFFSVDYTAGFRNFNQAFQKGVAQGEEIFKGRKEARKNYEETIYSAGDDMLAKMENLEGDAKMTEEAMQDSLNKFYDHALKFGEKQKGLKGLFTAREETRIDGRKLRDYTNSWTSNTAPIKAINAFTYNQEISKVDDLDRGSQEYEDQMYFSRAKEEGRLETRMDFVPGKGFETVFDVKDASGKVIETVGANRINLLFSSDSQVARKEIDTRIDESIGANGMVTGLAKSRIKNKLTTLKALGTEGYITAKNEIAAEVDEADGTTKYLKPDGTLNLEAEGMDYEKGTGMFNINKIPTAVLQDTNDIYNNKVPASDIEKIDTFKASFPKTNLTNDQIDRIMDKAMLIGVDGLLNDRELKKGGKLELNADQVNAIEDIYAASLVAKHKLTRDYKISTLESHGLLDEFNKPEEEKVDTTGRLTDNQILTIQSADEYFNVQNRDLVKGFDSLDAVINNVNRTPMNNPKELMSTFINKNYKFDGSKSTSIADVNVDDKGNITIYAAGQKYKTELKPGDDGYDAEQPLKNTIFLEDAKSATFNLYNPSDYKKLLKNFGGDAKDKADFEVRADKQMAIRAKELANQGKFSDGRYKQWFEQLSNTADGQDFLKQWMKSNMSKAVGPLWDDFYKKQFEQ